jgi:hypothetical protein
MSEPDRPLKNTIVAFLTDAHLSVEEITISRTKTPDLRINKGLPDETLLEIKSKENDPQFMARLNSDLESGKLVHYNKSTNYWNRFDGIITDGIEQLKQLDPARECLRTLWIHCSGLDADLFETRLRATLYGTRNLFCKERPNVVTCFYFENSSFFKHHLCLVRWLRAMAKEPEAIGRDGYEMLGRFKPRDAKSVLRYLQEHQLRFYIDTPDEVQPFPSPFLQRHWTYIYVHPEDKAKAAEIVSGDFRM